MLRLDAAIRQYRRMQRLSARAVVSARGAWRLLDQHALDATTPRYLARMLPILLASQQAAATSASSYVDEALREQGLDLAPVGELLPMSLVGSASDGRPLESLLLAPVRRVKQLSADGVPVSQAMRAGRASLERIVATQVADAGRVATGVEIAARPRVGYVRMLNPPSCSRCLILAGRWYRYSAGFQRHPQCDCIHVPAVEDTADDLRTDPRAYFNSLSEAEQDRIFGKAAAQAIRDGADMSRVVNARRGMFTAGGLRLTREATTRRGIGLPTRLMPEQIYREASSRDEAIRLLRRFGYIV